MFEALKTCLKRNIMSYSLKKYISLRQPRFKEYILIILIIMILI